MKPAAQPKLVFLLATFFFGLLASGQPVVTGFSPATAATGAVITINGRNFSPEPAGNLVFFGAVRGTVITAAASQLQVTVPAGATMAPITVTAGGRTGYAPTDFIPVFPGGSTHDSLYGGAPVELPTDLHPFAVVVSDLDGDGRPDLATPNNFHFDGQPASISVLGNTGGAGVLSFAPQIKITAGGFCQGLAAGDLDGDGRPELVASSAVDGVVSVFRNTSAPGALSFAPGVQLRAGNGNFSMAIGDLDGDGRPDLAVLKEFGSEILLFRNTGSPGTLSFAPPVALMTGLLPQTLVIADFNGDQRPDLAVTNELGSSVSVFNNTGTPGNLAYAPKTDFSCGAGIKPNGLCAADLNRDGRPDLAVTFNSNAGAGIQLFANNSPGNGSTQFDYTAALPAAPESEVYYITAGDMDGDGYPDLVAATSSPASQLIVYKNGSAVSGLFFYPPVHVSGRFPYKPAIADLDGDGAPELISPNFTGESVSVYRNMATQPFITAFTPQHSSASRQVTINGFNLGTTRSVRLGGVPAASFQVVSPYVVTAVVGGGASGDVSVTTDFGTASRPGFYYTDSVLLTHFAPAVGGTGTVVTLTGVNLDLVTGVQIGGVPAASFSLVSPYTITAVVGSGASGVVAVSSAKGSPALPGFVYSSVPVVSGFTPARGPAGAVVTLTGSGFHPVADSNLVFFGDVKAVVTGATANALTVRAPAGTTYKPLSVTVRGLTGYATRPFVLTFAGGGAFQPHSFTARTDYDVNSVSYDAALSDLDGDGRLDMVGASWDSGKLCLFRNSSSAGAIAFEKKIDTMAQYAAQDVSTADLDGDGRPEVMANRFHISLFRNTGSPGRLSFDNKVLVDPNRYWTGRVGVTDVNFDGRPDLFFGSTTVDIRRNTGTGPALSFGPREVYPGGLDPNAGRSPSQVLSADLNGDGKPEFMTAYEEGRGVVILQNHSTAGAAAFTQALVLDTWDYPSIAAGDIDGDGKTDIVVSNNRSEALFIYRNTGSNGTLAFTREVVSKPDELTAITIGDLNGDGRPDLVGASIHARILVWGNNSAPGAVALAPPVSYPGRSIMTSVRIGDLDGDGKPDIVASSYDKAVCVYRNQMGEAQAVAVCEGAAVTLTSDVAGTTYQWQVDTGTGFRPLDNTGNTAGATSAVLRLTGVSRAAQGYRYRCLADGGTQTSTVFFLRVNPLPVAAAGPDKHKCWEDDRVVIGLPAVEDQWYSWSPANELQGVTAAQPTANPLYTTTFTVKVENRYGCSDTASMVLRVTHNPPVPQIAPAHLAYLCDGAGARLQSNAAANATSQWYFNGTPVPDATAHTFAATGLGRYTVKSLVNGCASGMSPSVDVIQGMVPPAPVISQPDNGAYLYSSANSFNQWYVNGVPLPGEILPYLRIQASGVYTVRTTANGCASPPSNAVHVVFTAINSPQLNSALTILPNPAVDRLWIKHAGGAGKLTAVLADLGGRKVYEGAFVSTLEIGLKGLQPGVYILQVTDTRSGAQVQKRIIKLGH